MPNLLAQNPQEQISPNLIREEKTPFIEEKFRLFRKTVRTSQIILFIVELVAVSLAIYNIKLKDDLTKLDTKLSDTASEIKAVEPFEKEAYAISQKLASFNKIKLTNPKVQNKVELVYKATPTEIVINGLTLSKNTLTMNLTAARGEDLAKFVTAYLSTKEVSQVTLTGANFRPEFNLYTFDIEVTTLDMF